MEQGFLTGFVKGYFVIVGTDDTISVFADQMRPRTREKVKGLNAFIKKAKAVRLGWGQFQDDGDEVIYLYDKADGNFGYAVNLDDPHCSEWGYAPFQ